MATYAKQESPVSVPRDVVYPIDSQIDRSEDTLIWVQGRGQKVNGGGKVVAVRDTSRGARVLPFTGRGTTYNAALGTLNTVPVLTTAASDDASGGYAVPLSAIAGLGGFAVGVVYKQQTGSGIQDILSLTKQGSDVPLLAAQLSNSGNLRSTARRTDGGSQATAQTSTYTLGNVYAALFGFSFSNNLIQNKQLSSGDAVAKATLGGTSGEIPVRLEKDGYYLTLFNRYLTNSAGAPLSQLNRFVAEIDTFTIIPNDWADGDVSSAWYKKWYNILMARRQALGGGSFTPMV